MIELPNKRGLFPTRCGMAVLAALLEFPVMHVPVTRVTSVKPQTRVFHRAVCLR